MSILRLLLVACLGFPGLAVAAETGPAGAEAPEAPREQLYQALAEAASPHEARALELRLYAWWAHTESPSAFLIFEQASELMAVGDLDPATQKLDALTEIAPDYVEGWALRALANQQQDRYARAVADLERVLSLEPRHFRALSLLGAIFEELQEDRKALRAYEAAVEVNPHLEGGAEAVRRLTDKVKGRGI